MEANGAGPGVWQGCQSVDWSGVEVGSGRLTDPRCLKDGHFSASKVDMPKHPHGG